MISGEVLPSAQSATCLDSSFFSRNGPGAQLPSPATVRARSAVQKPRAQSYSCSFQLARYENLGLIVKFGRVPEVTAAEGQCLWVLRHALPEVPVPEVYGWTHDNGQVFIFMDLVQGATLERRWEFLDRADRTGICM